MDWRATWSNAPTASTDSTVARASNSVAARSSRLKASVPARVLRPNWKGRQASCKAGANCCARARPTRRRKVSPTTKARARPLGLRSATMRPKRRASSTDSGTVAVASRLAARWRSSQSPSSSKRSRRCSLVVPDGPAAEPRRAPRRQPTNKGSVRDRGWGGACCRTASLKGTCWTCGRRAGSRNSAKVSCVPGARGSAVRARLAADSSPKCASAEARSARACSGSRWASPLLLPDGAADAPAASASSCAQRPWRKDSARRSSSAGCTRDSPGARYRSMCGASRNSFQPRSISVGEPCVASSRPVHSVMRKAPRTRAGTPCRVRALAWMVSRRSSSSNCCKPARRPTSAWATRGGASLPKGQALGGGLGSAVSFAAARSLSPRLRGWTAIRPTSARCLRTALRCRCWPVRRSLECRCKATVLCCLALVVSGFGTSMLPVERGFVALGVFLSTIACPLRAMLKAGLLSNKLSLGTWYNSR